MMNIQKIVKTTAVLGLTVGLMTSCVSKKKYTELESNYNNTVSTLQQTKVDKEAVEAKYAAIEKRVEDYNAKINSLKDTNENLTLTNNTKYDIAKNGAIMSNNTKAKLREVLANVDPSELANARSLEDSMNLAVSYRLLRNIDRDLNAGGATEDISVEIDETVVMINISDKMLFKSGSARVNSEASELLGRIAAVVNSEPAIEVMVEGHTDSRTIKEGSYLKDNWDLSVKRATSIVRELQNEYNVDPSKLIASGRSSYVPLVPNDSKEAMALNRRTRILILPNLDKFLSLMASN